MGNKDQLCSLVRYVCVGGGCQGICDKASQCTVIQWLDQHSICLLEPDPHPDGKSCRQTNESARVFFQDDG